MVVLVVDDGDGFVEEVGDGAVSLLGGVLVDQRGPGGAVPDP